MAVRVVAARVAKGDKTAEAALPPLVLREVRAAPVGQAAAAEAAREVTPSALVGSVPPGRVSMAW